MITNRTFMFKTYGVHLTPCFLTLDYFSSFFTTFSCFEEIGSRLKSGEWKQVCLLTTESAQSLSRSVVQQTALQNTSLQMPEVKGYKTLQRRLLGIPNVS